MKTNEIVIEDEDIEDIGEWQINQCRKFLNSASNITENSASKNELREFFLNFSTTPAINNRYYVVSAIWLPLENHDWISLAITDNECKLAYIDSDKGQLHFLDSRGKVKIFPAEVGTTLNDTQATMLFDTLHDREKMLLLLKIKYSAWRIATKVITV